MISTHMFFSAHNKVGHVIYSVLFACILSQNVFAEDEVLPVAGWIEQATLYPQNVVFHAKLDTGAKTSSINAVKPTYFERDGDQWVRFSITNRNGDAGVIEQAIVRTATIRRHFGKAQERSVIMLDICIGPVRRKVEVSLIDRSGLNYQLLIGRNFLGDRLLVHSGSTGLLPDVCSS